MAIRDAILPEFDMEMGTTRKMLERVPEDKLGWKPHEKSMTLGVLASHVAEIPGWGVATVSADSFDVNPPGGSAYQSPNHATREALLKSFDENAKKARDLIASMDDGAFMQPWSLLSGGQPMFTMPKAAVLRSFVMNHLFHHRGQLSVYLRMNDVALPSVYGPTADEGKM